MDYQVQVERDHKYNEASYVTPRRWSSYAVQVREVMLLKPAVILEIGPGNNVVGSVLKQLGYKVETLDLDPRIKPTYIGSITDERVVRKLAGKFDLVLACQVFEHLGYKDFLKSLESLKRVAPKMVMSLPYTEINSKFFQLSLKIPGIKKVGFMSKLIYKRVEHQFDGEHYWEIGKRGYPLNMIKRDITRTGWRIDKSFLNPENPFHYFLVLSHKS